MKEKKNQANKYTKKEAIKKENKERNEERKK